LEGRTGEGVEGGTVGGRQWLGPVVGLHDALEVGVEVEDHELVARYALRQHLAPGPIPEVGRAAARRSWSATGGVFHGLLKQYATERLW